MGNSYDLAGGAFIFITGAAAYNTNLNNHHLHSVLTKMPTSLSSKVILGDKGVDPAAGKNGRIVGSLQLLMTGSLKVTIHKPSSGDQSPLAPAWQPL